MNDTLKENGRGTATRLRVLSPGALLEQLMATGKVTLSLGGQAVELDNDVRFIYRLEQDFDAFRREAAFVTFET